MIIPMPLNMRGMASIKNLVLCTRLTNRRWPRVRNYFVGGPTTAARWGKKNDMWQLIVLQREELSLMKIPVHTQIK